MQFRKALIYSFILHVSMVSVVNLSVRLSWLLPQKKAEPFEAKIIFKGKPREKNLLPRKQAVPLAAAKQLEKPLEKKPDSKPEPEKKAAFPAEKDALVKTSSSKKNFTDALKKLSARFSEDLASEKKDTTPEDFSEYDASYFDEVYARIKESFVVPPHINGPMGKKLQATLRLYILYDGTLGKVDLERSSGDEHFDKAVVDGTKRVTNFGRPPILLQNALADRGIVVDMCPFTCDNKD